LPDDERGPLRPLSPSRMSCVPGVGLAHVLDPKVKRLVAAQLADEAEVFQQGVETLARRTVSRGHGKGARSTG